MDKNNMEAKTGGEASWVPSAERAGTCFTYLCQLRGNEQGFLSTPHPSAARGGVTETSHPYHLSLQFPVTSLCNFSLC